ncbi:sugar phosphate nucleotidyltransferase [Fictibacillus halophilus]|uniref:sugar phosphate nucleotidyltransferase n=1 Tax=Fictibacillus halophilus TaxID=1610490 RepID=UPI001CF95226|nr:sugar phosphate nucleotidyltransferase [Fictibacillus halophilus]
MKILLLSGGAGRRLWPLSNKIRAKQFLKLLSTENNRKESMLQRVCKQLEDVGLISETYLITNQKQKDLIQNQVSAQIPIICEPSQKGTFSAVALAIAYLHSKQETGIDETICVLPVDAFADLSFFYLIQQVPSILAKSLAELAHIGVEPEFPSDQLGYIVPNIIEQSNDYFQITHFIEKPNTNKAAELIKKKALWNCGVSSFKMSFMLQLLKEKGIPTQYAELLSVYNKLPKLSFDVEVAEHSKCSIVVPYSGPWKDIGTWKAISEHMTSSVTGRGMISDDSINTHVVNELQQPVHVIGISNSMIVAGADGILVADKNRCAEVKLQYTKEIPRYVEKRWGSYKVLEKVDEADEQQSVTKFVNVLPNCNISLHVHQKRQEIWTILSGSGEVIVNSQLHSIKAGDVIRIPRGCNHSIKALTHLTFIEVQMGAQINENDIMRITYSWDEAVQQCT